MTSAPASRSPRTSSRRRRRERPAVPLAASGAQQMTLRRAPNIWAFVVLGGVVGIVAGILVGVLGAGNPQFTTGTVVLFMVSAFAIVGLGAGAVVALVLERVSVVRARAVTAEVMAEETRQESAGEEPHTEVVGEESSTEPVNDNLSTRPVDANADTDTGPAGPVVDGDPAAPRADDGGPTGPRTSREG